MRENCSTASAFTPCPLHEVSCRRNFPFPALAALRDRGYKVSWIAEDHAGSPDELVAAICEREERILLTFDKDFGELVFRRGLSPGSSVVLFRIVPDPSLVVERNSFACRDGNPYRWRVLCCGTRPGARSAASNRQQAASIQIPSTKNVSISPRAGNRVLPLHHRHLAHSRSPITLRFHALT